jgi:hypothetical protein
MAMADQGKGYVIRYHEDMIISAEPRDGAI